MYKSILVLALVIFFSNCTPEDRQPIKITVEGKNGMNIVKDVEFNVDPILYDSLKMKREDIYTIAKTSLLYSKWNVKNKLTYEFEPPENSLNFITIKDTTIKVSIKGVASNSFGVPGSVTTLVHFNPKDLSPVSDKDGLLRIISLSF